MQIVLTDHTERDNFLPFTANKAIADLRFGIYTVKERWEYFFPNTVSVGTLPYLMELYMPCNSTADICWVNATVLPSADVVAACKRLEQGMQWQDEHGWIACKPKSEDYALNDSIQINAVVTQYPIAEITTKVKRITSALAMMQTNEDSIRSDFAMVSKGRLSQSIPEITHVSGVANIFIEEGATVHATVINAASGPVYIGKNALVMEGCLLRGPIAIGEGAVIKMGAKMYGGTTIGNYSVAGGEIKNAILMDYSNKAHDGYLGDSIIGAWCNIGAGTSNSNVKNTGGDIKIWNATLQTVVAAGNKCGLMMGDYSRVAINSSINTGSWIGICANVFGSGLLPKYIPDFSWGTSAAEYYKIDNALTHIENWKQMKNKQLTQAEKNILRYIFDAITK